MITGGLKKKKKTHAFIVLCLLEEIWKEEKTDDKDGKYFDIPLAPPPRGPQLQSRSPSESSYAGFNSLKSEAFWFTGDSDTLGHAVHFPPIAPAV